MDREALIRLQNEQLILLAKLRRENAIEFLYKPRNRGGIFPNPKQEMILEALKSQLYRIIVFSGGNRCLTYDSEVDTPDGSVTVGRLYDEGKPFRVYSWDGKKKVVSVADPPFKKAGLHRCFEVETGTGVIRLAENHRVLSPQGYVPIGRLVCGGQADMVGGEKITRIDYAGYQEIYDFEVPDNHNYFAAGLINHNSGKTTVWVWVAISMMAGKWLWSGEPIKFPHSQPRKIRVVGQGWEDHVKKVVIPEMRKWWPKNRAVDTAKNNVGAEHLWTDKSTGSTLEIMSNLQDSDMFEGWSGDMVIYDEPCKRDVYIANARGLIDRRGKSMFCMTLLKEPWINQEIIKRVDADGNPDMSVYAVHAESWDNVGFGITQEGIEDFMKDLTEDEIQARIYGIPSYMAGLVCPKFKRQTHAIPRFEIPTDWIVDIGIDVHPRSEQAVLFVATNTNNVRYVCFEIYEHGDGPQTADKIVRLIRRYGLRVGRVVIDPLSKGDSNSEETTFDKIKNSLARHDIILEVASKDKVAGILEINKHLDGPNKTPSIFFFNDMKRTIFEIEGWLYDEDKQTPLKQNDHMVENLYRILLLDTVWYPPDNAEIGSETTAGSVDPYTGY